MKKNKDSELKPKDGYRKWNKRTKGENKKRRELEEALRHEKDTHRVELIEEKLDK